jgi:hypothetical protein
VNEANEVKKDAFKEGLSIGTKGKGKVRAPTEHGVTRQDCAPTEHGVTRQDFTRHTT